MNTSIAVSAALVLACAIQLLAAAGNKFEGIVSATLTRAGTEATHFVFTRKGDQLRIENTTNKLEPINIVDLAANKLTIIYPHNTTFVRVDLAKLPAQPSTPSGLPNFPTPPMPSPKSVGEGATFPSSPTGHIGPSISPPAGFPWPPPVPSMPPMPVGGAPALPNQMMMPPMPMPGTSGPTEFKKTDQTKKIQGFDCTLYTVSERGENFEVWATSDSGLFPFRLITRDYLGRRFGPQMLSETWPELLRDKSLFPLEATLKMEPDGQEQFSFKIDKIENTDRTGTKISDKVFQPPEKYIEIEAPQFC